MTAGILDEAPMRLTKAQRSYMQAARVGVLATVGLQRQMQKRLAEAGLIAKDHYGYFVLTDTGRTALDGQL
jgi:ribosomal protein S19E (S16A)